MDMKKYLTKTFSPKNLIMIGIGILLNFVLFLIGFYAGLPVWLDTTGTILVAVTCGFIPAAVVAVVNAFILTGFFGWSSFAYVLVSLALAGVFWFFARKQKLNKILNVSGAMLMGILVKALTCTAVNFILGGEAPVNAYEIIIYQAFLDNNFHQFWGFLFSNMFVSFIDGLGTVIFVLLGYRFIYLTVSALLRRGTTHFEIDAKEENLEAVQEFVEKEIESTNVSEKTKTHIRIAVEEIFSGIAQNGYKGQGGFFKISCKISSGVLFLELANKAPEFNPLKLTPDTKSGVEERQLMGMGIHIVKSIMENVHYRYNDGQNIISFEKKLV